MTDTGDSKILESGALMVATRKPPNAGRGRRLGSPNKVTAAVRAVLAEFVVANNEKLQQLFDKVAERDALLALEVLLKISRHVAPMPLHSAEPELRSLTTAASMSHSPGSETEACRAQREYLNFMRTPPEK